MFVNVFDADVVVPLHFQSAIILVWSAEGTDDRTQDNADVPPDGKAFDDFFVTL